MRVFFRYVALAFAILWGCSPQSNTVVSKTYHNVTARYNGYYYANDEIKKIEKKQWTSINDDYNRILRLFPALDSTLAEGYSKETEEAIKMASLTVQNHPNSQWVDDSYLLIGKARLYDLDWGNAIQTFKYVNTKSKDPEMRHRAIIMLIRTFTENKEFNNAQAAADFVEKEKLSKTNQKLLSLEKAYLYQTQGNYDKMVRNLSDAVPLLKKSDRPGRIYFIIGQVYQKLGFEAEAFNHYKKCLATNPEYEVDFYARLYMAQVTEITRNRSVAAARKSFKRLLKDTKNKNFRDKIFYEMGLFEFKQQNLTEAIDNYNLSIREGNNKKIDGEAYLRLGEIYFDSLKNYELSQAYYDSAVKSLPQDYEGYQPIKERKEILDEFVKNIKTIHWQDSLLSLASLDSVMLRQYVDSAILAREAQASKLAASKKKPRQSNFSSITANTNSPFNMEGQGLSDEQTTWYFGNPSIMSIGQSEFKRLWGEIPLEDNWRRSSKTSIGNTNNALTRNDQNVGDPISPEPLEEVPTVSASDAAFDKLFKEIPYTLPQLEASHLKIENAYYNLGDLYYFKLHDNENAVTYYEKLLTRFPESELEAEVLYKLYLIFKDIDPAKAEQYANQILEHHPESTFARTLKNPNYLTQFSEALERQKLIYKSAYDLYEQQDYVGATEKIQEAYELGETSFTPNVALLEILITGKTDDISRYQFQLDEFIKKYESVPLVEYAKKLLSTSRELQLAGDKQNIRYINSLNEPHYFVLIYKANENLATSGIKAIERFNQEYFHDLDLKTSNLILDDDYRMILCTELPRISFALEYFQTFTQQQSKLPELRNHNFDTFVITKNNFDIFYRTKGLDEYFQFFKKNYPKNIQ